MSAESLLQTSKERDQWCTEALTLKARIELLDSAVLAAMVFLRPDVWWPLHLRDMGVHRTQPGDNRVPECFREELLTTIGRRDLLTNFDFDKEES